MKCENVMSMTCMVNNRSSNSEFSSSPFTVVQAEVAAKRAELKRREAGSSVTSGSGPLPALPPLNLPVYR